MASAEYDPKAKFGVPVNPSYCWSTAISDAVLAATCLYGLVSMFLAHWANFLKLFLFGYIWFGFCFFASCLGVMRFGRRNLPTTLKHAHVLASWVAGAIGLPNLLAQFYMYTFDKPALGNLHLMTCVIPILAYFSKRPWLQELAGKIVAVISVVSLTAGGLVHSNMYAVGAALCIIAASPLDRSGKMFDYVPYVDVFHYLLAIANILLTKGLVTDRWDLPKPDMTFTYYNNMDTMDM